MVFNVYKGQKGAEKGETNAKHIGFAFLKRNKQQSL